MTDFRLGSEQRPLRVAVIGSGPSGFYAIGALFKAEGLNVQVDLYDRLPTPFGLVRGGVAPDHQNIKAVIRVYNKMSENGGFRFFGNVKIGRDLQVEDLLRHYDQVVYATGNETDRKLGIPGEELAGVHSGTEFVGWYNSHLDFRERTFDLERATRIAVVGNGNVAMDVTRILAKEPEELASSDIADWALEALGRSSVREILLLGRRGPAQAAFSPSEIKEIGSLEAADLVVGSDEVEIDEVTHRWLEKAAKSAHTNVAFLTEQSKKGEGTKQRKIRCNFLVSPVELLGEEGRLRAVRLERNSLFEGEGGTPRPRGTGEFWVEEVQLLFKCVGYRGIPIPGVSFDDRRGIFPNSQGRLMNPDTGQPSPGQYVVGWAKRGPTGLIGTNRPDSAKTVQAMVEDIQGKTAAVSPLKRPEAVLDLLCSRGVDYVTFEDWQGLDQEEVARGKAKGKVRDKFPRIDEMMTVIHRARKQQKSADS